MTAVPRPNNITIKYLTKFFKKLGLLFKKQIGLTNHSFYTWLNLLSPSLNVFACIGVYTVQGTDTKQSWRIKLKSVFRKFLKCLLMINCWQLSPSWWRVCCCCWWPAWGWWGTSSHSWCSVRRDCRRLFTTSCCFSISLTWWVLHIRMKLTVFLFRYILNAFQMYSK